MFTPQDSGTTRKVFQKPNILRRKPKAKQGVQKYSEFPEGNAFSSAHNKEDNDLDPSKKNAGFVSSECLLLDHGARIAAVSTNLIGQSEVPQIKTKTAIGQNFANTIELSIPSDEVQDANVRSLLIETQNNTFFKHDLYTVKPCSLFGQQDNYSEDEHSLNIESFLVDSPKKQSAVMSKNSFTAKKADTDVDNKWCLNFMSDDPDIVTSNFYDGAQISKENTDLRADTILFSNETYSSQAPNVLEQDIIQSCLSSKVIKFKCDLPNCNKSFWNEARLQKHKATHNKQKPTSLTTTFECPVKKVDVDGVEQRCSKLFPSRDILVKHLNEDHVPEDAVYRCTRCGRRFWWATGLRTHAQSSCLRALECAWPGCGRVFRQPCRLREHARAHTGDRPYPCTYPNCGWAFRSASKLVRHARRHTGERRHECAACGRAFPRREHLRDHAARHHAPPRAPRARRAPRPCTYQGCDETFATMSSLYMHLKKVHRVENKPAAPKKPRAPRKKATPATEVIEMSVNETGETSIVGYDGSKLNYTSMADAIEAANASAMIMPEGEVIDNFTVEEQERVDQGVAVVDAEGRVDFDCDLEGRCARTHCTWPLQKTPQPEQAFTIEDDTQVEQSESSESNIYTVRSDLFLHGNVLINEDSEFIIRESSNRAASEAGESSNAGQLDGLDLIDSHPAIDLMQEELMYGDAAVDESSFRVFLMNGEELS